MLYLSQLLGNKIKDSADNVIGRLEDVLVHTKTGDYAPIQFLEVKSKKHKKSLYIKYDYL